MLERSLLCFVSAFQKATAMLDIPPPWRKDLEDIFQAYACDYDVLVYGSRTNGTAHAGSDLDLVLRHPKTPAIPCSNLVKIQSDIRESSIPILVDLQDWARLPDVFQQQILEKNILLFTARTNLVINAP